MRTSSKHSGMTLVEVMVTSAVLALVGLAVTTFFVTTLRSSTLTTTRLDNNAAMRRALEELFIEARTAQRYEIFESATSTTEADDLGESGNYLVLYYTKLVSLKATPCRRVVYFIDTSTSIPRLVKHIATEANVSSVNELSSRPTVGSAATNPSVIVERITNADGGLNYFHYIDSASFRFRAGFCPSKYLVSNVSASQALQRSNVDIVISTRQ